MEVTYEVVPNQRTMNGLKRLPDRVLYTVAEQVLSMSETLTPMSPAGTKTRGQLRRTSQAGGVRGGNGSYYIGSYTSYASYVWNMPDSTNWTTGGTNNKWFTRTLKRHKATITDNAINRGWKDVM